MRCRGGSTVKTDDYILDSLNITYNKVIQNIKTIQKYDNSKK